jgi:lysine 2,3-aminomutase
MMQYFTSLDELARLSPAEKKALAAVTDKFAFRANDYYLSLIDWSDPADPIRRLIVPSLDELDEGGKLDPSDEQSYTILPGLEHKYNSTALLLVSNVCEGICRYCFRKRVFIEPQKDIVRDFTAAFDYIAAHTEITNVLLTGGDPLALSTHKLEAIISRLRQIDHVQVIRIGSRMPVFNPYRILDDPALTEMIEKYSLPDRKIYVMTHFAHPRELTEAALEGVMKLQKAGAILTNQCPLIRGVNDKPDVLAELMRKTAFAGIVPYYIFQCRPALGNAAYSVPIEEGYQIVEAAKARVTGLAKRLRFVMSHSTGKIEIIGADEQNVFFKYHRAAEDSDSGRILICQSNPSACWLDDYEELQDQFGAEELHGIYGPE